MKEKAIQTIFWVMVAVFIILIGTIFALMPLVRGLPFGYIFPAVLVIFIGLGITLIVLTVKKKVEGTGKAFLLLTGASAVGMPVFVILHNLVYALLILWFGEDFWGTGGDEPVFFILGIIVCPLAFLVGVVGTIVLNIRNKQQATARIP
jgi:hypothetical protein